MKKFFVSLIGLFMLAISAYALNPPTNFVMSYPSSAYNPATVVKVTFTMPANATVWDSILVVLNSDSTSEVSALDTTGVTWTSGATNTFYIASQTPMTSYKWQVRVVDVDTTETSNGDTLITMGLEKEYNPDLNRLYSYMDIPMKRWDSWTPYALNYTSITLTGATDKDSTIVYTPFKYNNITGYVTCAQDSVNFSLNIYAGQYSPNSQFFYRTLVDSLAVTSTGAFNTGTLDIPPCGSIYAELLNHTGAAGAGNPVVVKLWLNRNRD